MGTATASVLANQSATAAAAAAARAGVEIVVVVDADAAHRVSRLLSEIWARHDDQPIVAAETIRTLAHVNAYGAMAMRDSEVVGAALGFLGGDPHGTYLHSYIAGVKEGLRAGRALTGVVNMLVAFPGLILALFVAIAFGVGATGAVVALGIAGAPALARLTQTLASSVGGTDYVAAARVLGVPRFRLLSRHILPNIAEPLVLNVTTAIGYALLAFSALSFLGLGVQPPFYDWGRMLNEGLGRIYVNPAGALAPGAAIVLAGLTFNLLGEGLAQVASGRQVAGRSRRTPRRRVPVAVSSVDIADDLVLDVGGLSVSFPSPSGEVLAVRDVSLAVRRGELVGILGESGSGKTVTALAIAQLVSFPGVVTEVRFRFDGRDVLQLPTRERRRLLATSLPMVFQNPGTALNPAVRVGRQLAEVSEVHDAMSRSAASNAPLTSSGRSPSLRRNGGCARTRTSSPAA